MSLPAPKAAALVVMVYLADWLFPGWGLLAANLLVGPLYFALRLKRQPAVTVEVSPRDEQRSLILFGRATLFVTLPWLLLVEGAELVNGDPSDTEHCVYIAPTSLMAEKRQLLVRRLSISPAEIRLGQSEFRLREAWVAQIGTPLVGIFDFTTIARRDPQVFIRIDRGSSPYHDQSLYFLGTTRLPMTSLADFANPKPDNAALTWTTEWVWGPEQIVRDSISRWNADHKADQIRLTEIQRASP